MPKFDSRRGREAAQRSAIARRAKKQAREEADIPLPPLDGHENALTRLAIASDRVAAGVMTAQDGHSFARLHEIWLRTHEGKLTRDVVEDMKKEVDRLKGELKGRKLRVAR